MIDVVEVLQHWHAGRPKTVVAASLGVDVKTIRKYVAAAEAEGIRPGDGLVSDRAGWAARVAGWFPELVDAQARSRTWPELEGRRELITKMMETNTLATVHQRLRDEHGVAASESSLRRYVGQAFGGPPIAPGDGAAAGRAGRGGTDRLRLSGQLGGSGGWPAAAGAGVRDRAGLLPAHVRAAGAAHGCHLLGGRAHCGVGVLRRRPAPAGHRKCSAEHFRCSVAG